MSVDIFMSKNVKIKVHKSVKLGCRLIWAWNVISQIEGRSISNDILFMCPVTKTLPYECRSRGVQIKTIHWIICFLIMRMFKQNINDLPCVMKRSVGCSPFRTLNSIRYGTNNSTPNSTVIFQSSITHIHTESHYVYSHKQWCESH